MTPAYFRSLRRNLGLRQQDVAARLGVTPAALCQYEKGRVNAVGRARIWPVVSEMVDEAKRKWGISR